MRRNCNQNILYKKLFSIKENNLKIKQFIFCLPILHVKAKVNQCALNVCIIKISEIIKHFIKHKCILYLKFRKCL